jgi:uncharacterized protein YndB with AHSA1/START domain
MAKPTSVPNMKLLLLATLITASLGGAHALERAIDKSIEIPATLDQAWQAWTSREGIVSFFAPGAVIDPRVGGAFHIHFDPGAAAGSRGADDTRYMALQPQRMVSFDWNAPPSLPEARAQRTFVTVRFAAVDAGTTRVTLHHTGWGDGGEWDRAYAYFDRAWGAVLANLKKRFESGPIDWAPFLKQLDDMRAKAVSPTSAPR